MNKKTILKTWLVISVVLMVSSAQAGPFPGAGDDSFSSAGVFKVTLSPAFGGGTMVIWVDGPTCVARSAPHSQTMDPSGMLGGSSCIGSPSAATSDTLIGYFPPGYNAGGGSDEVHTEIIDMSLTSRDGWSISIGASATGPCPLSRSLGEVEARGGSGFPADSFFNLYVEVFVPIMGMYLYNPSALTVEAKEITAFPPAGADYRHSFDIKGKVALHDCATGCFVAWLEQGTHAVDPNGPGEPEDPPSLRNQKVKFPVVFSVNTGAEGLLVPDLCTPMGHPFPNDVYVLGTAGVANTPPYPLSWGYATEGELFQSSGAMLGMPPDITNVDRISAALGVGPGAGGPPYTGPFMPPVFDPCSLTYITPPPTPSPLPLGGAGTLGLFPGDNITSVSFGRDGGNVLIFSVDPTAIGAPGTAVEFESTLSPPSAALGPFVVPSTDGGDPGDEAAGDLFFSSTIIGLGPFFGVLAPGGGLVGIVPAPAIGLNTLAADEGWLGLQAPAVAHSALGPPEDDLDALEAADAAVVDIDVDGIIEPGSFVFFTLSGASPSLAPLTTNDILVSTAPNPVFAFGLYASGVMDIGLLPGDIIDALALADVNDIGGLDLGADEALFSLAAGSPSLAGSGANANMPGPGPFSPGDVFYTSFPGPPTGGPISLYASAAVLGLLTTDELNALDIGFAFPCHGPGLGGLFTDSDSDGVGDLCDNCPETDNPPDPMYPNHQLNSDGDSKGDVCDDCPFTYNKVHLPDPSGDYVVTLADFAVVALYWMDETCDDGNDFCSGADIDKGGTVNMEDLNKIAVDWLEKCDD